MRKVVAALEGEMMDREKVIKGLESLRKRLLDAAARDKIAMLDALIVSDALVLLKAQEPVEPTKPDEDNMVYCGACGSPVGYEVLAPGTEYVLYSYCPVCGRAVKWDG